MTASIKAVGADRLTMSELRDSRAAWWTDGFTALLRRQLAPIETQTILDLGCGVGILSDKLYSTAPGPADVLGVDIDISRIRHAKRGVAAAGQSLPFAPASFSATVAILTLQHIAEPLPVLSEMGRVTRPGGLLLAVEADNRNQRLYVSAGDAALEQSYAAFWEKVALANPEIHFQLGPHLPSLFVDAGLDQCQTEGFLATRSRFTDPRTFFDNLRLRMEMLANRYGMAASDEYRSLLAAITRSLEIVSTSTPDFYFIFAVPMFVVTGSWKS